MNWGLGNLFGSVCCVRDRAVGLDGQEAVRNQGWGDWGVPSQLVSFLGRLPQPWGGVQREQSPHQLCFDTSRYSEARILEHRQGASSGSLGVRVAWREGRWGCFYFDITGISQRRRTVSGKYPTVHLQFCDYKITKFPFTGCHRVDFLPCYQTTL